MEKLELITTHVNADFDGLGAMIGVSKLYPDAYVIFPGSQEKGISDPFVQSVFNSLRLKKLKSISAADVGRVILVDTRSPKRLGGLEEIIAAGKPEIHIYDHHPFQPGDIEGNKLVYEDVGSTSTIIAAILKDAGIALSKDEATLVLAGIYEDTGSLTYSSTREKDFYASAWLLSRGADLQVVRDLISRELSKEQLKLMNEMLNELRTYTIHGYDVGLTAATSEEFVNDFAVLVQKVKDMESLPVIFGIGRFGDRIFIAARSRIAEIDVANILKVLGGGGHPYAASATVKGLTIFQVEETLLNALREKVSRPKVAHDIMSLPVKFITPDTTVAEAKEVLTRYNVNMLPVCEKKEGKTKIVGLVSRQNVEKAAFHGYTGYPVKNFMTTEFFSIKPDSDISVIQEYIFRGRQRLLPVVNEDEEPLGVVTRTDFLRIIQDERIKDERAEEFNEEYSKKMRNIMLSLIEKNILERLEKAGELASSLGFNAFLVGGIVRDLLLHKKNYDVDIVVEGDGLKLAHALSKTLGAKVTEHKKFGTAQLIFMGGEKIDIATARIEYYPSPASLPTIEKGSLKLDMYRRDFTINTLAVKLNPESFGELIDYFGGVRDLKEGVIRVLHNLSFVEDPTRAFRAVRFEMRFNFKLSKHTLYLIRNAVKMNVFGLLKGSRMFTELELILNEEEPHKILDRINDLSMFKFVHEKMVWKNIRPVFLRAKEILSWYDLLYTGIPISRDVVYFLCLCDQFSVEQTQKFIQQMGIAGEFAKKVGEAKTRADEVTGKIAGIRNDSDIYFILNGLSMESILYYMARTDEEGRKKIYSKYLREQIKEKCLVTGDDLIALGLSPSRMFTKIFNAVLQERLKGHIRTKEDEISYIRENFILR